MASAAQGLLDHLWERYSVHVPYTRTFVRLAGGAFENDHVAFRSLRRAGRAGSGLELFAPIFERLGWRRQGSYDFKDAKLSAIHLSHPQGLPRVFVSELRAEELSPRAQEILAALPEDPAPPRMRSDLGREPSPGFVQELASWFCAPDAPPDEEALLTLEKESQYGAWLMLFGREVNHFTASVDRVEPWAEKMARAGVPMKGEIEGEEGAGLRQTATRAAPRRVRTDRGERDWPYAYLEIAERNGGFDGFVEKQARQLFEMTRR